MNREHPSRSFAIHLDCGGVSVQDARLEPVHEAHHRPCVLREMTWVQVMQGRKLRRYIRLPSWGDQSLPASWEHRRREKE